MKIEKLKLKIEQEIENADINGIENFELGYIKALEDVLHHLSSTDHFEGFKRILEYHKQELDNFRDETTTSTADLAEKVSIVNTFPRVLFNLEHEINAQIPMEVHIQGDKNTGLFNLCPVCSHQLFDGDIEDCPRCGQSLLWGDENN